MSIRNISSSTRGTIIKALQDGERPTVIARRLNVDVVSVYYLKRHHLKTVTPVATTTVVSFETEIISLVKELASFTTVSPSTRLTAIQQLLS